MALALLLLAVTANQTHAQTVYTPYAFTNFAGRFQGTNDGIGSAAQFKQPEGVAVDSAGIVYVADRGNNTIRKITPDGAVTTLAGTGGQSGSTNGTGSEARFNAPIGLAVDGAGIVYVADSQNQTIRKITPMGEVTTLAGSAGSAGSANGTGSVARFNRPFGVALDSATNIYVADCNNNRIRKVTPAGLVTTLAGGTSGTNDGTGTAARFNNPQGLAVDSATNIFVTDTENYTIRKIAPSGTNWVVTTLAGSPGKHGTTDGIGGAAQFEFPNGVALDSAGNLVVVDQSAQTIRRMTPAGVVTTLAGRNFSQSRDDGIGSKARFFYPSGLAMDSAGNVYVGDMFNNRITKGTPALVFDSSPGSLMVSNGFFQMRVMWPFVTNVVVESSPDFQGWTPIQTNALTPEGLDISVPLDTSQNQFFRAHLIP